jgi:anti-anti-sigma factor
MLETIVGSIESPKGEADHSPMPKPVMATLEVTIAVRGPATVIRIAGEATYRAAERLELAITPVLARRPALVVVDLAEAGGFSSLAIAALVGLRRSLGRWGGKMRLAAVPALVRETLEVTRVLELFEVFVTVEQALA